MGEDDLGGGGRFDGSVDGWPSMQVPDDLSELARDPEAYRAEQRAAARRVARARRRARAHPLWRWLLPREHSIAPGFAPPSRRRLLLPLAMTGIAVVLCAVVAVLLTALAPRDIGAGDRTAMPLAPGPGTAAPGGLLPNVSVVDLAGQSHPVRGLRPAVLLLLPAGCACARTIDQVAQDAAAQRLPTDLVVSGARAADVPAEASAISGLAVYLDPAHRVAQALGTAGPAAVVIEADGLIDAVVTAPNLPTELSSRLQQLFAGR